MAQRKLAALQKTKTRSQLPTEFAEAARLYRIRTKEARLIPFDYERWTAEQKRFHAERTGRDLILKPRQVGITSKEQLRGLHQAHTRSAWNVEIVIHDHALAAPLFRTVRIADSAVRKLGAAPALESSRGTELAFGNGSGIRVSLAGKREGSAATKGRSGTINRLHATEVAFWSFAEETMNGLLGAVPTTGEVLIESTANGASGWFYNQVLLALHGESPYRLHFFPWFEHAAYRLPIEAGFDDRPRDEWEEELLRKGCDAEQVAFWRSKVAAHGLDKALQEYPFDPLRCFRASGDRYIDASTTDWMATLVREPIKVELVAPNGTTLGTLLVFDEPRPGETYLVGGDVAEGTGGDGHSATCIARSTGLPAATFWSDSIEPGDFGHALAAIGQRYGQAWVGPERNNHGAATLRALETEARYPRIYRHDDGKLGWPTTSATRPVMFDELARALREKATHNPDAAAVAETSTLIRDKDGKPRARGKGKSDGAKDDRFVSHSIAWQLRNRKPAPSTTVGDSIERRSEADDVGSIM